MSDVMNEDTNKKKFQELFEIELQNRAFALKSSKEIAKKAESEGDKRFYNTWVKFEEFLKRRYAPYAKKYNLTQEPGVVAKLQAGFGKLAAGLLPDSITFKTMLDETITYLETLKELEQLAPQEDSEFFAFVVEQEEMQIHALKLKVDGKNEEVSELMTDFIVKNAR